MFVCGQKYIIIHVGHNECPSIPVSLLCISNTGMYMYLAKLSGDVQGGEQHYVSHCRLAAD